MKVLVVRPMELPAVQEIDHTLSAMQELVGGTIQAVYPFDDPVALVCNDEGKLLGLPWNRTLTDDHGVPYDIVCGTFFVAGLKEDDFASLTEQQIEKYKDKYSNEMILSVPKQPEAHTPIIPLPRTMPLCGMPSVSICPHSGSARRSWNGAAPSWSISVLRCGAM